MFRVKPSEIHTRILKSAAVVLTSLLLASALSVAAVSQVVQEYNLRGRGWPARSWCRSRRSKPCDSRADIQRDLF